MFLIIGCGYVGEWVADLLHEQGHEVVGVTHSEESAHRLGAVKAFSVQKCDISDALSVQHLADKLSITPAVILHCASSSRGGAEMYRKVYLQGCQHLQQVFPHSKIFYTSSSSVYEQVDGSWVTEESPAQPDRETGAILRATEDFVLHHEGCVARLGGIYGAARSFVLKNFLEGKATIEGNEGQGRYLNQIHRHDAATSLVHLMLSGATGIFNVVDSHPMTQRACFDYLAAKFKIPMPEVAPPNTERKRAWTHKRVSNAKLLATGFAFKYPAYFDALEHDGKLVPSIMAQINAASIRRGMNVVLIGLMGSGKSSVGRLVSQKLGFGFVDTDTLIIENAGMTIPEIFASEGEAGFRKRETEALRSLMGKQGMIIATGGGIVTQPENIPLLQQLGYVVWLNANLKTLLHRTSYSDDRPLLRNADPEATLSSLLEARKAFYQDTCDLRITTDDLSSHDVAYGIAETVRVYFQK
ncbi:hypothetical protein BH11VER1_BH11VER1_32340 [soil metagenome]